MEGDADRLIEYFEQRRRHRRRVLARVVIGILLIIAIALAVRVFLHVTGIGASTTLNITPHGFYTTKNRVPIIP